jgi:hypothetical protein
VGIVFKNQNVVLNSECRNHESSMGTAPAIIVSVRKVLLVRCHLTATPSFIHGGPFQTCP